MAQKKYKISPPLGNFILPKEIMTEQEVKEFVLTMVQDSDMASETWREKIAKDPIEDVIDWLRSAGYIVNEVV